MALNPNKKAEAEARAMDAYRRLMILKDEWNGRLSRDGKDEVSNNQWTRLAGVSTSFFTNMQGVSKPASEPSVGNLRAVLEVAGTSLPEFFLAEAKGRLVQAPTIQALERVFDDALVSLPKQKSRQAAFLALAVHNALGLPASRPATQDSGDVTDVALNA